MRDPDLKKERSAFEMLQWNPYQLPAEFDWELAALGVYSAMQRERSDKALDAFDAELQAKADQANHRSELDCFRELELLGVFTQRDFYSPTKAKDEFYSDLLKTTLAQLNARQARSEKRQAVRSALGASTGSYAAAGRRHRPRSRRR